MVNRSGQGRKVSRRWAASVGLGLFLMLFNVFNAATMGLHPMAGMETAGPSSICATHHEPTPDHHPADCCSCCLSMCCTGAMVPDCDFSAVVLTGTWTAFAFHLAAAPRHHRAPITSGSARSPPDVV